MNLRVALFTLPLLALANVGCLLPFGPHDVRMSVCRATGVDLKQDLAVTTDGLTLTTFRGLLPLRLPLWHTA